jgi:hypothetical protein
LSSTAPAVVVKLKSSGRNDSQAASIAGGRELNFLDPYRVLIPVSWRLLTMIARNDFPSAFRGLFVLIACGALCSVAAAGNLLLSDGRAFPGELWRSRSGARVERIHRRDATANPAYPQAAMKLGQVAVGPDQKIYFASGLDGYVIHLLDGVNEVLSFEFPGQIRDLDCGGEEHTVYFSVVPTPQNGAPLADGKIYRRDLWAGQPSEVATVRQADVGGNWWGAFAIQDGTVYVATLENPSRIFKLTTAGAEQVFPANRFKIQGLAAAPDGKFLFTDGTNKVYRTADFDTVETAYQGDRPFTDVALEPDARAHGL